VDALLERYTAATSLEEVTTQALHAPGNRGDRATAPFIREVVLDRPDSALRSN